MKNKANKCNETSAKKAHIVCYKVTSNARDPCRNVIANCEILTGIKSSILLFDFIFYKTFYFDFICL